MLTKLVVVAPMKMPSSPGRQFSESSHDKKEKEKEKQPSFLAGSETVEPGVLELPQSTCSSNRLEQQDTLRSDILADLTDVESPREDFLALSNPVAVSTAFSNPVAVSTAVPNQEAVSTIPTLINLESAFAAIMNKVTTYFCICVFTSCELFRIISLNKER